MKDRSLESMKLVLVAESVSVSAIYIIVGFFGFATWSQNANVQQIAES